MCTHQTIARMAKDPAVSSISLDCLQRADMSLVPESDDSSRGDHDMLDLYQVEAVTRRLSVHAGAPWGIDRIDTKGEPVVNIGGYGWPTQLPSAPQRSRSYRLPLAPSSLALPTGGAIDSEYDDGDLTGTNVRVYIVDTGVQGSHDDFGGRVVNGNTVRAASVARVQSSECPHTPPPPASYSTMRPSTAPHHLTTLNTLTTLTTPSPLYLYYLPTTLSPHDPFPQPLSPLAGSRSRRVQFVPSCQRHPPRQRF